MMMTRHVLCPVDFSECSRQALDRASAIARMSDASLTVLHIVAPPSAAASLYVGPEALGPFPLPEVDPHQLQQQLRVFVAANGHLDDHVTCLVVDAIDVAREILAQAIRLKADYIVMGTHGRSGIKRLVLGSVTEKVMRGAPCTVVTIPLTAKAEPAGSAPFQRILCAIDFSPTSLLGLKAAVARANEHGAHLGVLHVMELAPPIYDPVLNPPYSPVEHRAAAEIVTRHRLHEVIPAALESSGRVEALVGAGRPDREILRMAAEWRSDLIVLGVARRTLMDKVRFGSAVEPVIRQAPCPVMTVHVNPIDVESAAVAATA
jgi:nucleotide-binding universal stress UspA family protein